MAKVSLSKGKTSGTKSNLKANGARYSTTNRQGVTSYYSSSKDVDNGKSPIKTVKAGTNIPVSGAIPANNMSPVPPVNVPTPPTVPDIGNITGANNAGLASGLGYSIDSAGQFVAPTGTKGTSDDTSGLVGLFQAQMGMREAPVSEESIYNKEYKRQGIAQKEADVQNYTTALNTIVANRDAAALSLEGQGRGQTEGFVGGEQARINREAAIQALPVQAQLAAAQGNLEMANAHLETVFKLKSADARAQYDYKNKLIDSVYNFATTLEQKRLDGLKVKEDRAYTENKDFLKIQQSALANALGQGAPASVYNSIKNAKDKNSVITAAGIYNGDVLGMEAQRASIAASRAATANSYDSIRSRKEADALAADASKTLSGKPQTEGQAKANGYADRLKEAEGILKDSDKFGSIFAIGGMLPNAAKSEDRQKFEQAQRNFINAVLRRESGAVISEEEFANARQQYFPQQGDGSGVLAQKASNRNTVINSFYREASVNRPVSAGDIIEADGKRYKVGADGETLTEI